jgi:hypothetical protein
MDEKIHFSKKPRKCPKCGFSPMATILYGMPVFSDKLKSDLDSGKISLGGCCVHDPFNPEMADPVWECTHCQLKIFRTSSKFGIL